MMLTSLLEHIKGTRYERLVDKHKKEEQVFNPPEGDKIFRFQYIIFSTLLNNDEWVAVTWSDEYYRAGRICLISLVSGKYITGCKFTKKSKEAFINNITVNWNALMDAYKEMYSNEFNFDTFCHGEWCKLIVFPKGYDPQIVFKAPKIPDFKNLKTRKYPTIPFRKDIENHSILFY